MALDESLARQAIAPLAERLGFPVERTAHGMLGIVVANMVRAIRAVSVERGHDPRAFALVPFGGAGPLHATDVAKSLGICRMPRAVRPWHFMRAGADRVGPARDIVRTAVTPLDEAPGRGGCADRRTEDASRSLVRREHVEPANRSIEIGLDARYVGQNFELAIGLGNADPLPNADEIKQRFFAEHERAYGFHNPADPIEIVNFRLIAAGKLRQPAVRPARRARAARPSPRRTARCGSRPTNLKTRRCMIAPP